MAKKYTFMFFSSDKMGKVRTVTLSRRLLTFVFLAFFTLAGALGFSLYNLHSLSVEKENIIIYNNENNDLKAQLAAYTSQIETIVGKIGKLDELEYKIRDLITLQQGAINLKPIAVGGKEVDLLREYSSTASLNEKDFFNTLDNTLNALSYEVSKRELNLADLAASLEEKRITMLYTPTIWPVKGWLSSQFGYRASPFSGRQTFHEGIDIATRHGKEVRATAQGTVVFAGTKSGYGYLVTIDHGYGYLTRYGHNSVLTVKVGDKVEKGQVVGKAGSTGQSTGTHVHYEVLVNGIPVNPLKFIIEEDL